jgi:hypothetical protein
MTVQVHELFILKERIRFPRCVEPMLFLVEAYLHATPFLARRLNGK